MNELRSVAGTDTLLPPQRRWLILGVTLVGAFMAILDVFIVTQGLPSIRTTLGANGADVELVVSIYSLVYAVFLVTGGRLGDILDRKRIFLVGMAVFTLASSLAAFASYPRFLVAARALQGLGAALMYPQVLSIIQVTFEGAERALALALYSAITGLAAITGNLLGGLLIQLNLAGLSWRPIFLVNLPIGIIGVLAGSIILKPSRAERRPRLDLAGVGLISLFLLLLVFPLAEGLEAGWPIWMIGLLISSFPALGLFAVYERKRTKRLVDPLVDTDLFHHRSFKVGIPLVLVQYIILSGLLFTLVLFLQSGLGFSPLVSGVSFAMINIGFITSSLVGPKLLPRLGSRILTVGFAIIAFGLGWTLLTLNTYGTNLEVYRIMGPLMCYGAGAGFVLSPLIGVILSGVPGKDVGAASGVVSTSMQIGNTVGISFFGLLFYTFLGGSITTSYLDAFKSVLPVFILLAIAGFLLAILVVPRRGVQGTVFSLSRRPGEIKDCCVDERRLLGEREMCRTVRAS